MVFLCTCTVFAKEPVASAEAPGHLPQTVAEINEFIADAKKSTGKVISAKPFRHQGLIIGYRILLPDKEYRELYQGFGLLPEDIFTRVNGIPLVSLENAIKALESVVTSASMDAEVIRDGETVDISIQLD